MTLPLPQVSWWPNSLWVEPPQAALKVSVSKACERKVVYLYHPGGFTVRHVQTCTPFKLYVQLWTLVTCYGKCKSRSWIFSSSVASQVKQHRKTFGQHFPLKSAQIIGIFLATSYSVHAHIIIYLHVLYIPVTNTAFSGRVVGCVVR